MAFTSEQLEQLGASLSTTLIKQRKGGGGSKLAYIKGKTAIDQANLIFGFGRWGYEVTQRDFVQTKGADGAITSEFYTADVVLQIADSPFTFPGDGVGIVLPSGPRAQEHEKARKEAVTDALKRALRHFGGQFANDLYDDDATVVDENGDDVKVGNIGRTPQRPAPQQPARPAAPTVMQPRPVAPTAPSAGQEAKSAAIISERQINSVRKLCEFLSKPEPDGLTSMSDELARELIRQLTAEYRQQARAS